MILIIGFLLSYKTFNITCVIFLRFNIAAAVGEGVQCDRDGDGAASADGLRRLVVGLLETSR
jgi:hypothetical protein